MADVSGADPSLGTWRYYFHDHLGSTRALRAGDKSSLGSYEYTPYDNVYAQTGVALAGSTQLIFTWQLSKKRGGATSRNSGWVTAGALTFNGSATFHIIASRRFERRRLSGSSGLRITG